MSQPVRASMIVLGVHLWHDSSAELVIDGRIVADVAEERFTRIKHYSGLPIQAVHYCLKSQNFSMADINVVAVSSHDPVPDLNFFFDLKGVQRELSSAPRGCFA